MPTPCERAGQGGLQVGVLHAEGWLHGRGWPGWAKALQDEGKRGAGTPACRAEAHASARRGRDESRPQQTEVARHVEFSLISSSQRPAGLLHFRPRPLSVGTLTSLAAAADRRRATGSPCCDQQIDGRAMGIRTTPFCWSTQP